MALRDAILSTLAHGESSGYDLAKEFDVSTANFWPASPQQLYRELGRLEEAGLIQAKVVQQSKRPNKRVFRLTKQGELELRAFTERTPKPTAIRDELLVQLASLAIGDPQSILQHVRELREQSERKFQQYQKSRNRLLAGEDENVYLSHAPEIGRYLTLLRGLSFEVENIRWCDLVIETIERRSTAS